jgi:putative holliday junction resolvase
VGDRWIGLAQGDSTSGLASPLRTLRRSSQTADLTAVRRAYDDEGAEAVVVGLPYNMDGSLGPQARRTLSFVEALRERGLPVDLCDERLSSAAAYDYVTASRGRPPKPGERIDHVAAAIILQDYLDSGQRAAGSRQ